MMNDPSVRPSSPENRSMPRRLRYIVPILLALLALAAPVIWLIGRASVWPEALWPARGAVDVSTRAVIRIILNREPDADEVTLTLDPAHAGELRVQGREIVYTPATPLGRYHLTVAASRRGRVADPPVTWHFTTRQPRGSTWPPTRRETSSCGWRR